MGTGVTSTNLGHFRSILDNLPSASSQFEYNDGYFGQRGNKNFVRIIICEDPILFSKRLFDLLTTGGEISKAKSGQITIATMSDGTIVSLRLITSTENSPAVEINIRNSHAHGLLKFQKIHFIVGY